MKLHTCPAGHLTLWRDCPVCLAIVIRRTRGVPEGLTNPPPLPRSPFVVHKSRAELRQDIEEDLRRRRNESVRRMLAKAAELAKRTR